MSLTPLILRLVLLIETKLNNICIAEKTQTLIMQISIMLGTDHYVHQCRAFLLYPKHLPLLGPVFGEAFAELGKGERGRFFAVEDGFDDVRGEVD